MDDVSHVREMMDRGQDLPRSSTEAPNVWEPSDDLDKILVRIVRIEKLTTVTNILAVSLLFLVGVLHIADLFFP